MQEAAQRTFWLADGTTSFTTIGTVHLRLRIDQIVTTISALVVRHLSCECILGMDWVMKYRVDVCHSAHLIRLHDDQGRRLTTKKLNDDFSFAQFTVKFIASLCLQPYPECQVRAFVPVSSSPAVLFQPRPQLQLNKPIRTPDAVSSVDDYLTSLTIYNDSDQVCHLANGTLLSKVQLIDSNTSLSPIPFVDSIEHHPKSPIDNGESVLSESVKKTIMSATNHIADEMKRTSIGRVLVRYSQLFDTRESTVAATSMNHAIRTSDHAPIATKPYPQSQQQRSAMTEHVSAMVKSRQIRMSNSPWSSPALLPSEKRRIA